MLEVCQSGVTWCSDITQGDMDPSLTCHMSPRFMCITYPIGPLERNTCHPDPPTCQFLICVRLANMVGEMTGTLGVWDFETLEDLGCSMVERPNGPKAKATW
jgi:hypothetical protein